MEIGVLDHPVRLHCTFTIHPPASKSDSRIVCCLRLSSWPTTQRGTWRAGSFPLAVCLLFANVNSQHRPITLMTTQTLRCLQERTKLAPNARCALGTSAIQFEQSTASFSMLTVPETSVAKVSVSAADANAAEWITCQCHRVPC